MSLFRPRHVPDPRRCWNCNKVETLVHDPLMPYWDQIKVCPGCAIKRRILARDPHRDQQSVKPPRRSP